LPASRRPDGQETTVPAAFEVAVIEVKVAFTAFIVKLAAIANTGVEVQVEGIAALEAGFVILAARTAQTIAFPGESFFTVARKPVLIRDLARARHGICDGVARVRFAQVGGAGIVFVVPDEAG
jgi:hypothetical protein